jgi:Resolvase, N terminal domain
VISIASELRTSVASPVAGREGESFISPDIQRKKITACAELHEVEIVQWWEELDMSGADRTRPMFQRALERCERGETGGIVVARLDRTFVLRHDGSIESLFGGRQIGPGDL